MSVHADATTARDIASRSVAPTVVIAALILFAWTHRHALSLEGFADDLGLLSDLPRLVATGQLWSDLWARATGPLWPQSTMWRPWAYASFGWDAAIWGARAAGWHLTNLMLHGLAAVAVGLLTVDVRTALAEGAPPGRRSSALNADSRNCGAFAFALFLLCPWAPEVTCWLVGRFDAWATLGIVLAVWAGLRAVTAVATPRVWTAVSLTAAAFAYASKESALMIVPWLFMLAIARWATRSELPRRKWGTLLAAHCVLLGAYVWWRQQIFASESTSVYGGGPATSALAWLSHLAAQSTFPAGLVSLASWAAATTGALAILLLLQDLRAPATWRQRAVGLCFAASVLAAVALYLPAPPGAGEGFRLYYLAAPGMAIALAATPVTAARWRLFAALVLLLACAQWQSRVVAEWTRAGRDMRAAASAIRQLGDVLLPADYALVLMPDQHRHVPFARNAQGGLIALAERGDGRDPPLASGELLSRLILFTPPQLDEWRRLAGEQVVTRLTSRADAPANPTRYFCFDRRRGEARDLGYWPPEPGDAWSSQWRERTARECPELQANWR